MELLLAGIFSTAALVFTAYPLIGAKKHDFYAADLSGAGRAKKLAYLNAKKKTLDANIKDLELEHEMGKLSQGDFESLQTALLAESDQVTKDIDGARLKRDIDELIEKEVWSRRRIRSQKK